MKVREKSISYAIVKNSKTKSRENALHEEIADLERKIDTTDTTNSEVQKSQLHAKIDNLNCELEKIIEQRTQGAILRSRTRWHNEGEKKYEIFFESRKKAS